MLHLPSIPVYSQLCGILHLRDYPFFMQVALVTIAVSFAGIIVSCTGMLLFRNWRRRRDRLIVQTLEVIDALLMNEVVMNEELLRGKEVNEVELSLEPFQVLPLQERWCRQLMVQEIIRYRRVVNGATAGLLRELYLKIGLHGDVYWQLHSSNRKEMIRGLYESFQMDLKMEEAVLLPLTHHPNRHLMEMARCCCVKLLDNPFAFLDTVTQPLLQWEKLELHRLISQRQDIPVPSFERWIDQYLHPSAVSFAVRMAGYFQQFEAAPALINLLETNDLQLRAEAINSLGKLAAEDAEPCLVSIYPAQPLACKEEILKALGRIGSGLSLDFLEQEFLLCETFTLRKHAATSIVRHRLLARELVKHLEEDTIGQTHAILEHSLNPLIRY